MKVLVIDNYDSFVYNLAQYIGEQGCKPMVYRNDKITLGKVERLRPDRILISPGPGTPEDTRYFGVCNEVIRKLGSRKPILGVCLGHQGIVYAYGGRIKRAARIMHGKTSLIEHDGKGVLKGLPNPLEATRYHSLVGDSESMPRELVITAFSLDDHEVMGVRHMQHPVEGVQFHPESIMTASGKLLIKNFLS